MARGPSKLPAVIQQPLLFAQASLFLKDYRTLNLTHSSDGRAVIWHSYQNQMDRVFDLGEMPITATYFAGLFVGLKLRAMRRAAIKGLRGRQRDARVFEIQKELFDVWQTSGTEAQLNDMVRRDGGHNLERMIWSSPHKLRPGIEATLAAMLADAWAAFEILAGDLWVEAVNGCPAILGDRACASKSASLKEVSDFGYDLRQSLGSFLVETGKFDFSSLRKTQAAYAAIFNFKPGGEMMDPFSPFDRLDAVSQVRNCFAHRAGIVDQRAVNAVRRLPSFSRLEPGARIPLDGGTVCECINLTVICAITLFQSVDVWFQRNTDDCRRQIERRGRRQGTNA